MSPMPRVLEPELMEDAVQAAAYARADFSSSNQWFADHLSRNFPTHLRRAIDIGCGPADVAIRVARHAPGLHLTAVDGSAPMLALAREAVRAAGLDGRIALVQGRVPGLRLEERSFDAVISKDVLHHLPDPDAFWREVRRLGRPGGAIYVMDLMRAESPEAASAMVERVVPHEAPVLKDDFYNSLLAAFTIEEIIEQLRRAGLHLDVAAVSDRHMLIKGLLPG